MTVGYSVEVVGLEEQLEKFKRYSSIADKHLLRAMHQGTIATVSEIRPLTPVGVSGALRNSIASEVKHEGPLSIVGTVGSTLRNEVYPEVMEFGRRPGKAPPASALLRWVHLKLGVPNDEAYGVAIRIARAIGARGIKGKKFMQQGWDKAKPKVIEYFERALHNITQELSNGRN